MTENSIYKYNKIFLIYRMTTAEFKLKKEASTTVKITAVETSETIPFFANADFPSSK